LKKLPFTPAFLKWSGSRKKIWLKRGEGLPQCRSMPVIHKKQSACVTGKAASVCTNFLKTPYGTPLLYGKNKPVFLKRLKSKVDYICSSL
jgi:hypothetical protein